MTEKKLALAVAVAAALGLPATEASAQVGEVEFFGSVYAKFLDGDRRFESALYNNAETTPGEAGGDQGQGIEFELMFRSQVSRQVEMGGRIKARFNQNFWTNFGGFGPQEEDERSAQYMKLRGVWVTITPGYDWIDSATIGSNDWGMFDPLTVGKFRYIDRDNSSGLLFQGSAFNNDVRWDFARVSLARLFQGPRYQTTNNPNDPDALEANDAAWIGQLKWNATPDLNLTAIAEYIRDKEIDPSETNIPDDLASDADLLADSTIPDSNDILNGTDVVTRYDNTILALKGQYSGIDAVDIGGSLYWSDFNNNDPSCAGDLNGDCRFSPTLQDDANDYAWFVNIDVNTLPLDDLTFNLQLFSIGADYTAVTAARREADVLLTEGREGTWMWGRPDYNFGNRANGNATAGVGYGGWNGDVQQVVSLMADNDFTDFDEPVADSVIGWQGVTIVPRYVLGDWEFAAEYSYVDFDTDWQACNNDANPATGLPDKDDGCMYPRQEGIHQWGLGGDTRSPYAPYQDRDLTIAAFHANYTLDLGAGVDLAFRYKYMKDEDDRVTNADLLSDAYDGYPEAAIGPQQEWVALRDADFSNVAVTDPRYDDREAEYNTFGISAGYQLTGDLYTRLIYEYHHVDLIDGTIDVAPVAMGFEASNEFGYAEYLTGEHHKNRIGLQFNYFLSGVEFGGSVDWLIGEYDPKFLVGQDGSLRQINPADSRIITNPAGNSAVITPLGNISMDDTQYRQYRLKAFMKVSF